MDPKFPHNGVMLLSAGRQWARRGGTAREPGERPRRRIRATYHRTGEVLNGTDFATHREQGSMIRRYIACRNRNTSDPRLRRIVDRANAA